MPQSNNRKTVMSALAKTGGLLGQVMTPGQWATVWETIERWYCESWVANMENAALAERLRIELQAINLIRTAINRSVGGDVNPGNDE